MMKLAPCLLIILLSASAKATTLDQLAAYLTGMPQFCSTARYEVFTQMFEHPICYDIILESHKCQSDSLSAANYLIEWALYSPSGETLGFDSYFDGNHFRLRNDRLQEYHFDNDSSPFMPTGCAADGVQNNAQFTDLLPQFIGEKIWEMSSDSSYNYQLTSTSNTITLSGNRNIEGYVCKEFNYTFDSKSLVPICINIENNPGQPSEQSISVKYQYNALPRLPRKITTEKLIELFPNEFAMYRQSAYSLENLPGKPLPKFSACTLDGTRYSHPAKTSALSIIVFLDTDVATTDEVIQSVRKAYATMPFSVNLIWAFISGDSDKIGTQVGKKQADETTLMRARNAARDCGVVNTPTIIFCNKAGTVCEYIHGYNNNLGSAVIEKASITNSY